MRDVRGWFSSDICQHVLCLAATMVMTTVIKKKDLSDLPKLPADDVYFILCQACVMLVYDGKRAFHRYINGEIQGDVYISCIGQRRDKTIYN